MLIRFFRFTVSLKLPSFLRNANLFQRILSSLDVYGEYADRHKTEPLGKFSTKTKLSDPK